MNEVGASVNQPLWTDVWSVVFSGVSTLVGILAVVGVFMVRRQIVLQRRQMHHELENLYVDRYWVVMDRLAESGSSDSSAGLAKRRQALEAYLRLSEDECDLRARDRVTDETWDIWKDGIKSSLRRAELAELLDDFQQGELEHLREMRRNPDYDPSKSSYRERKKQGLIRT